LKPQKKELISYKKGDKNGIARFVQQDALIVFAVKMYEQNQELLQRVDIEGIPEDFYEYDLVRIPDKGQQIEDYELFKTENPYILPASDESERKNLLSVAKTYAEELTY